MSTPEQACAAAAPLYLLVDDDLTFLGVLERSLQRRGLATLVAGNSAEALRCALQHPVTHAVLDLKIDRESGLHLIEALHALRPGMAIVMLTAWASVATAVEAIKLGATHYLGKPASVDEILAAFGSARGNTDVPLPAAPASVDRVGWEHIQKVLSDHDGNISAAARAMGMHRRTLQRKLMKRPPRD